MQRCELLQFFPARVLGDDCPPRLDEVARHPRKINICNYLFGFAANAASTRSLPDDLE
jgi:hypothetical protein